MKKLRLLLFALLAAGCEVLEENISGKEVRIIAPADRVSVTAGKVAFLWQVADHAAGYEFTVVAPSFAAAGRIVADTVIYADTLARSYGCHVELETGEYEWSVRGFNAGYTTRAETRALTVVPAENTGDPENPEEPGTSETPKLPEP